jgi:uncharacterized DUF497 family protein
MEHEGRLNVKCNPSAFKHGITEADIRFAFDHILFDHPVTQHEEKNLLIGLDRQLNLIEIFYNEISNDTVNVFHAWCFWAMPKSTRSAGRHGVISLIWRKSYGRND